MNQPTPASAEPARSTPRSMRADKPDVSVVIPVFNSAGAVGETIDRVAACLSASGARYEIIAVNDASTDQSWRVLERKTRDHPALMAINLERNCGQRAATMCGLEASTGAYVITIDDDLQHPPEELPQLIAKADAGHDLIFAGPRGTYQETHLNVASALTARLTSVFFGLDGGLDVSSFRLIRRDVVDRMLALGSPHLYVTGLAILCARHPANVRIAPPADPRRSSNYTLAMRLRLLPALFATAPRRHRLFAGLLSLCAIVLFGAAMFMTLPPRLAAAATGVVLLVVACLAIPALVCVVTHDRFQRRRQSYAGACRVTEVVPPVRTNEATNG
jgi:hypothetical protein